MTRPPRSSGTNLLRAAQWARQSFATMRSLSRADDWWNFKLASLLSVFYATALRKDLPIAALAWELVLVLAAIVTLATFVSLINDATDLADDAAAGKANRLAGRSASFRAAAIALTVAAGLGILYGWRNYPVVAALYLAGWVSFTLYSLPPVRLKARGFAGVLADGCGAHAFPSLAIAAAVLTVAAQLSDSGWLWAVGCWSLGYGMRGNLWHQLSDRELDRAAGVATFGARHSRKTVVDIGRWCVFPLELAGLLAMLWQIGSVLPVIGLVIHGVLIWQRAALWRVAPVVTDPVGSYQIVLHDYYDAILPVTLLLAAAIAHPLDWAVLAVHVLLFHARPAMVGRDAALLLQTRFAALRQG